jgi:hypothetical protein
MSKKLLLVLTIVAVVVLLQSAPVFASSESSSTAGSVVHSYFKSIELVVGEKQAEVNYKPVVMEQAAYVKQGRTLVPLRFIGESLGAQVAWNDTAKQAVIKLGESTMTVTVGSKVAYVDGEMTTLEVPAEIKGGRTFVPLRFVSESFGAFVDYDSEAKSVLVRYVDETGWEIYSATKANLEFAYPEDWKVTSSDDGLMTYFTSPKGSKLTIYFATKKPSDMYTLIKDNAKAAGWIFDAEDIYNSSNKNEGFSLDFKQIDKKNNGTLWNYIYVDPMLDGSYVVDQVIEDEDVEIDNIVMLGIAN